MSVVYCEYCDKYIDTDFDAEHFDYTDKFQCVKARKLKCDYCGLYYMEDDEENYKSIDETGMCLDCNNEINIKKNE